MTDPISFSSTSPRFGLPLLYAGQSQKETYVNEAHALTDALLHCAIESITATPPASPTDGQNWLVGASATGDWAGMDGKLACRQAGNWIFVSARDGMVVLNRGTGQQMRFSGVWKTAAAVNTPTGGTVVDDVARSSISQIINALQQAGIIP